MQESTGLLVGDVLLSAACIAYYGAFPGNYRQELLSGWVNKCKENGIPVSPDCTLRGTMASPIQVPFLSASLPACLSVRLSARLSVPSLCYHEEGCLCRSAGSSVQLITAPSASQLRHVHARVLYVFEHTECLKTKRVDIIP